MNAEEAKIYQTDDRNGNYIITYTGRLFYAFDTRPQDIHIKDIAHALAYSCRFSGHCHQYYSIAQHSVVLSRLVGEDLNTQRWALLHDAAEAYITDMPRPIKHHLQYYKTLENNIMKVIAKKFELKGKMPAIVKDLDHRIVADEADQLWPFPLDWTKEYEKVGVVLNPVGYVEAEELFLERFYELWPEESE